VTPKFAADENLNNQIIRALMLRVPDLDIVRVQDAGLAGMDDPTVLDWAAGENRVLLTHDVRTMTGYVYERLRAGKPMPGVVAIRSDIPVASVIETLMLMIGASFTEEWDSQIRYIPL
jgi:predicted nuclease of predicted toxin-antitoxin system